MEGAAFSVLVDGLTEDGYFADAKVFGSIAWTVKLDLDAGSYNVRYLTQQVWRVKQVLLTGLVHSYL